MILQNYCDILKIDWKTQTNKFILSHSNGFSPSLSEHWGIVFIQLSSVHSDWEKKYWNVVICKTTTSRCFQNNAQPKETMLSPSQPIELEFFKKLTN